MWDGENSEKDLGRFSVVLLGVRGVEGGIRDWWAVWEAVVSTQSTGEKTPDARNVLSAWSNRTTSQDPLCGMTEHTWTHFSLAFQLTSNLSKKFHSIHWSLTTRSAWTSLYTRKTLK
eukprot:TRINITY_DN164_c0_g1_i26.p1 TRINITY_DN164_c0_g1~~TRINITY_DN164_c0_g1_i26.p1  ORF type:complete len:117 (+),score=21.60 TRINITY_DN164_c0_g1_i26:530-880(+)